MNHFRSIIFVLFIGTVSTACDAQTNKVSSEYSKTECTANIRHNAPEKHIFFYTRDRKVLDGKVDRIPFSSRHFKGDGKLYYRGPRYTFVPEEYLVNMSEGCKLLPQSTLD